MTRVNVGIDPRELPRQALLAEHREIKRIPNQLREGKLYVAVIPKFGLGRGHVKFFTTRLKYLRRRRYRAVHAECVRRRYNVQDFDSAFVGLMRGQHDYEPTRADRHLMLDRLSVRGHELKRIRNRNKTL